MFFVEKNICTRRKKSYKKVRIFNFDIENFKPGKEILGENKY